LAIQQFSERKKRITKLQFDVAMKKRQRMNEKLLKHQDNNILTETSTTFLLAYCPNFKKEYKLKDLALWCSSNALDLYSPGTLFESPPTILSEIFVVSSSRSRQMLRYSLDQATAASLQILLNPLFTNLLAIKH
jgi:hypothetical protein